MKEFTLRIDIELYEALKKMGKENSRDVTNEIRFRLKEAVKQEEEKNK